MVTITLDEYVNAFGLRIYNNKDGYTVNETHEDRLAALRILSKWVTDELVKEFEARKQATEGII